MKLNKISDLCDNKKINVLFFIPPNNEQLLMERDEEVNDVFGTYHPLGLMYVATYLKNKFEDKVNIKIVDYSVERCSDEEFEKLIHNFNPHIVGTTVFTPTIMNTKVSLEKIKKLKPDCVSVIGGAHVTSFQEDSLSLDCIDYGIMGYGEYSFYKLIDTLFFNKGKLEDIPNLIYRKDSKILKNPISNDIIPIDDLPIPDRTLIKYELYRCPVGTQDVMATLISSRGCPFQCTFCNSPDKKYKEISMEKVIGEVRYLKEMGFKEIFFFDDLFNLTKERVYEFCRLLDENNIKINWSFRGRVNNIDEALIKTMKKHGCQRIHFGIETHTDESLKRLKKGVTVEQIKNAVRLCYKYKINSAGSFMINLPGDTVKDILDRFNFANSLKLDYNQYAILVAYNHSEIFDDGVKNGLWDKNLWLNYIKNPNSNFVAPIWDNKIDRKELDKLLKKGLKSFYFRPGYFYQRIRNIHSVGELKKYLIGAKNLLKIK